MKNLFNIKSILISTICMMSILIMGSMCSRNQTLVSEEFNELDNINRVNYNDNSAIAIDQYAELLTKVTEMQFEAIMLGELAQQKGNSAQVIEFGKMMVEEHNLSHYELKTLVQTKSVSIPISCTERSKRLYDDLNLKTGNDFGKTYSDMMVDQHEDAIILYKKVIDQTEDSEIRIWATKRLSASRTHHERAKELKNKIDNLSS